MRTAILLMLVAAMFVLPGASAKNDDPCRGFWYYEEDLGHVRVYTNGSAGCTGADVLLPPLVDCDDGIYRERGSVGSVTYWEYRCP